MSANQASKPQAISTLISKFEYLYCFFRSLSDFKLFIMLFSISFLKNGIRGIQPWPDFEPVESFPKLEESYSTLSVGWLLIAKIFGADSQFTYFLLSITLLLLLSAILFFESRKYLKPDLLFWFRLWFFLGFPMGILLGNIGRHDLFSIFGLVMFFLVKTKFKQFLYVSIAMLGCPEHVFLALILSLSLTLILNLQDFTKYRNALLCAFVELMMLTFWARTTDISGNRFQAFLHNPEYMRMGALNWMRTFPYEWLGYFGPFWLIFFCFFALSSQRKQKIHVALIFILPMLGTILLLDKTRDFVLVVILPFMILSGWVLRELKRLDDLSKDLKKDYFKSLGIFVLALWPNLEATFEGTIRIPFSWLLSKLMEYTT